MPRSVPCLRADDGQWSRGWADFSKRMAEQRKHFELYIIEPQPSFNVTLSRLASSMNATFMQAAASKAEGVQTFFIDLDKVTGRSTGSKGASLERPVFFSGSVRVRTFDFAAWLREKLGPSDGAVAEAPPHSLLKLDVERLEYSLVPWLLAQGGLCLVRHLLIEWHLNQLPFGQRLRGLGLRLALHTMLEEGCTTPPVAIYHDDYPGNNYAVPVPGLHDLVASHGLWAGKDRPGGVRPSAFTVNSLRADQAALAKLRSSREGEPDAAQASPQPATAPCQGPVRCMGSCRPERLACDERFAAAAYEFELRKHKVVPLYFDNVTVA